MVGFKYFDRIYENNGIDVLFLVVEVGLRLVDMLRKSSFKF